MNTVNKLIKTLKLLKENNSVSSYSHIKNILKNQILPVAVIEFKPYRLVRFRRHNNNESFFNNVSELTYRTDILNIDEFGRANEPGQGFFYCNDNNNMETGMSEAMSILRGNNNSQEEILTASVWDLNETLKLAMILPSKDYAGKNMEFDKMKSFYNNYEKSKEFDELKIFNEFLAEEFIIDVDKNDSNYKISCAYANYIKDTYREVDGIIYGSVKSEFEGSNIVLWPEVVNKKLKFFSARKQILKRVSEKDFVEIQVIENKSFNITTGDISWL